jgi:hypothetical protein
MRLSRPLKIAIACACVAAAWAAVAALPAVVAAQPAPEEYELSGLPSPSGDDQPSKAPGQAATKLSTSRASGGPPVLLIAIAVIGAICAGLGAWRLRRASDDPGPGT